MLLDLPDLLQKKDFDCGACASKICFDFLWKKKPLKDFSSLLFTNAINGTEPRVIESFFRREGFGVLVGEMDYTDLRHFANLNRPVILLVHEHYVVSRGLFRNKVYIADPARGRVSHSREEFDKLWLDQDRFSFTYNKFGICIWNME